MEADNTLAEQICHVDSAVLQELIRRATDLDNTYRAIAEKAGQLYMKADEAGVEALTVMLDKPMRNASDHQRTFAGVVAELQAQARRG